MILIAFCQVEITALRASGPKSGTRRAGDSVALRRVLTKRVGLAVPIAFDGIVPARARTSADEERARRRANQGSAEKIETQVDLLTCGVDITFKDGEAMCDLSHCGKIRTELMIMKGDGLIEAI